MRYFMIVAILSLCVNLAFAQSPNEAKPSFDCTKATTKIEKMICSDSELARLDRLYSKLYFTTLKAILKDTPQGKETRENLKAFNRQVMEARNSKACYYSSLRNTEYIENKELPICIKDIYLEALVYIAYNMLGEQKLLEFIEKDYPDGNPYYSSGRYDIIANLAYYNLYDRFFDAKHKNIILEFFNFSAERFNWVTTGGMSVDSDYNEVALEHREYYNKLDKAFRVDTKLNKLLGK
ncbi:lysozyme inhibitor LprI family protein [Helicobacter monodelphidis]|uniref:lysozyme inhibitor LprI family protein n=1 Tax=Helicobacter sp. 15-1451 TaxID=2004995 RepID=UPI0015EBB5A7|nr:hypothetical protein [Helicobacter sp. 15-1451]